MKMRGRRRKQFKKFCGCCNDDPPLSRAFEKRETEREVAAEMPAAERTLAKTNKVTA